VVFSEYHEKPNGYTKKSSEWKKSPRGENLYLIFEAVKIKYSNQDHENYSFSYQVIKKGNLPPVF